MYEPISPQIYILPEEKDTSTTTSTNLDDASSQNFPKHPVNQDHTYASIAHTINAQIEELIQKTKPNNNNNNKPILLENKPARIACRFRPITNTGKPTSPQSHPIPIQQVYWYHNKNQPVHVPPFYVDNSLVNPYGLSILSVRAYPITFNMNYTNEDKSTSSSMSPSIRSSDKYKLPVEHLTCSVISRVKETPEYKVISNARLGFLFIHDYITILMFF
ncbi:unnamed protein product [Trichobilharzia regenti]|nr:unnamed protein product [Trichobilharzia regenti]